MNLPSRKVARLELGGLPRVNLLPPEVTLAAKARALHRVLSLLVVAVMVLVGTGYGLAQVNATSAQHRLDAANQRTAQLLAQQKKYVEVRKVTSESALVSAARQVGASMEINWQSYLADVQASLPSGTTIVSFTATNGSPLVAFEQPTAPLQGERIAQLSFLATANALPDVGAWLNALAGLKGFVDAAPGSVTRDDAGVYKAQVVMHINQKAFANRFPSTTTKDAVAKPDTSAGSTTTDASKDGGN